MGAGVSVIVSSSRTNYRFRAVHPDGSCITGAWCERNGDAESAGRHYAREWLLKARQLGMQGQTVAIELESRVSEERIFTSAPSLYAKFSHVEVDQYGNPRGIS